MVGYYNYTVWLTYLSLISGGVGIYFGISGHPVHAVICLLICGILDLFDGKVARTKKDRTEDEKQFGIQIDSLTDLVCFGVLPCVIGYASGMTNRFYMILFAVFILFGMIRLAYYIVLEMKRQECKVEKMSFLGVPITMSSVIFPFLYCFEPLLKSNFYIVYAIVMGLLGISYIIKIKIPKPNLKQSIILVIVGLLILTCILVIEHVVL